MPDGFAADSRYYDALGCVYGTAAAQSDNHIQFFCADKRGGFVYGGGAGVGLNPVKDSDLHTILLKV